MSHTTTLTIGGTVTDPVAANLFPTRATLFVKDGYPTLTLVSPGAALAAPPDPYLGKSVSVAIDGTTVFAGDVVACHPEHDDRLGWVLSYQCLGLRHRGDRVPFTDDNTGLDTAGFNLQPDDPQYFGSRAGRTVGQVLTTVLTMVGNATNLNSAGIGQYSGLPSAPALPAATVSDLAALTLIPPCPVYVGNEKLVAALEGFLAQWAPNVTLHVKPDGTLRFLDLRTMPANTLTLDTDPVFPTPLSRDWGDGYSRVLVRGQPLVEAVLASLSNGLLAEDFGYTKPDGTAVTSAAAKAAFTDAAYQQSLDAKDAGSCTCPSTTTVTCTSSSATLALPADYWDQSATGRHAWVYLYASSLGGSYTQVISRRVVASTALTAGGSYTLTLDRALPVTSYTSYQIYATSGGPENTYRLYSITNSGIASKLANQFNAPVPFVLASGGGATLTSFPIGSAVWGGGQEAPLPITIDPSAGTILFNRPTWELGRTPPTDVRALLAVNYGANQAVYPADVSGVPQYGGTVHTVEGRTDTLTVTVDQWRDPGQQSQMNQYAQDLFDSVSQTVVEGAVTYLGLYTAALDMGQALTVAGPSAPWSGLTLPVLECAIEWDEQGGSDFITRMRCSNRRAHLTAAGFLRPERTFPALGGDFSPFETSEAKAGLSALPAAGDAVAGQAEALTGQFYGDATGDAGDLLAGFGAAHDALTGQDPLAWALAPGGRVGSGDYARSPRRPPAAPDDTPYAPGPGELGTGWDDNGDGFLD